MGFGQRKTPPQVALQTSVENELRKIRLESREERQRLQEEIKAGKAREDGLKRLVQTLQADNPEAKIQADALRDQTRLAERRRLRCRALMQQMARMRRDSKRTAPRDYTRIQLEQMPSRCEPGEKALMSMQSIADSGAKAAEQPVAQQVRSKRKWRFSKFAGKHVLVKLPSPYMSRLGKDGEYLGGLEANPRRQIAMVMNWCWHNLSISATCRLVASELAMMQEEVHVCAKRHKGQTENTRRSFPGNSRRQDEDAGKEKKLDVFGIFCEATLTQAIHAFNTTVDLWMSEKILSADGIHLSIDISTFSVFHQQSIHLFAFWVKEIANDAAGNPMWAVTALDCFLPSLAVGEKLSRRLHDTEGNQYDTSTTRAAAGSLVLSNLLGIRGFHNVSVNVDGGGEGAGCDDPSSAANSRTNKNGLGSYRFELFVTGEAFEQAMKRDPKLLNDFMDFSNVPDETRLLLEKRNPPKTLLPVTKFNSCERTLCIRERNEKYTKARPVWNEGKVLEVLPIRPSMTSDPISCMALVKGGVANVFSCLKHMAHTLALHSSKLIMPHVRALASVILAFDNIWIFTRVQNVTSRVFLLDNCGPQSELQKKVSEILQTKYPKKFAEVQARYKHPKKFARISEACETRWGAVGDGAEDYQSRAPELAVGFVLTFSEGLDEHRIDAAVSVWSEEGFCHNGKIKMSSPKIGTVVCRQNDPGFIFGTCLNSFFHMFVHNIPLVMSSYHKESSAHVLGGVGSLLRSVHYFLIRGMWVICPMPLKWPKASICFPGVLYTSKKSQDKDGWAMHYPLQWKALVSARPRKGMLMLNVRASKGRASLVHHLYGPAFRPEMQDAISKVCEVINTVSRLKFDNSLSVLPKGLIRTLCSGPQVHPHERRALMIRAVAILAVQNAKNLEKQFGPVLNDPHLFLAGISSIDSVKGVNDSAKMYYVASDVGLANAACLYGQMRELEQGYAPQLEPGEKLGDFMHGPLRTLFLNPGAQNELVEFRKAGQVLLDGQFKEDGSYGRSHPRGFLFRPRPFGAFPGLAKLSLTCAAQPKTNQKVEGGFSLASMAFRCYRRNQGPELNSDTIRKKNAENLGVIPVVQSQEFVDEFTKTIRFRRVHHTLYRNCFRPNNVETEAKYEARMKADLPQYIQNGGAWKVTNFEDLTPESANVLKRPDRNGGRKQNSRQREAAIGAYDIQTDADRNSTRAPGRRRLPVAPSAAPPMRWTVELLNKESCDDLRDMCRVQNLVVKPSKGVRVTKNDFVVALLEDQDRFESQAQGKSSELPMAAGYASENGDEVLGADSPEPVEDGGPVETEGGREPMDQVAHAPSAQTLPVGPAVPATADATDRGHDSPTELDLELQLFLRECREGGVDPFDCDVDEVVADSELENFNQAMSANAGGVDAELSESDSEDAGQTAIPRTNAFEDLKRRKVGVWKREYAEALAESSSWKPCKVVGVPTRNMCRSVQSRCLLGTALKTVRLERVDECNPGKQFTVNPNGRVFYLLRTPVRVELVKITQIYYPKDCEQCEGDERPVWIEYYRVFSSSDAIPVCDRRECNFQQILSSEGNTVLTSSAGSKQLEIEMAERAQQGKSELYHWGDVQCNANVTSLIGGVYWLTKADEKEWTTDCQSEVLKSVKDKIPVSNLRSIDRVVVGSAFSDSN